MDGVIFGQDVTNYINLCILFWSEKDERFSECDICNGFDSTLEGIVMD